MDLTTLLQALVTAAASGAATLAVIRIELRYLRRDVDAAHRRLDAMHAPSGWGGVSEDRG